MPIFETSIKRAAAAGLAGAAWNTIVDDEYAAQELFPMTTLRVLIAGFVLLAATLTAGAQQWPSRPVRFIVPFPAGGSTDVGARVIGEFLSRSLHQQIVVENKSGANGNIGIDPLRELVPVVQVSRQPMVLAAHPSLGISSLAELTALARGQPGLRYATGSGYGSPQHMVVQ